MRQTDRIRSIVLPSECLECFMSGNGRMDGWNRVYLYPPDVLDPLRIGK